VGDQFREHIGILKVRSERGYIVRYECLARFGSKKLVVLTNLNCQENDAANNSDIGDKRSPFIDFGTVHVQSLDSGKADSIVSGRNGSSPASESITR
jgi:hypothetical protein